MLSRFLDQRKERDEGIINLKEIVDFAATSHVLLRKESPPVDSPLAGTKKINLFITISTRFVNEYGLNSEMVVVLS